MDKDELLDSLTGNGQQEESAAAEPQTEAETDPVIAGEEDASPAADPVEPKDESALSGKSASELLDSLTDDPSAPKEKPAEEAKPEAAKPDEPKTPEQEEAELLDGVKSERGRERIKAVFEARKASDAKVQTLEADIDEFKQMIQSTGMKPEEFAQTLEYGRLVSAGDEKSLRVALQMVDSQREAICKQLGIEAPGIDPLSDFPELKRAVEAMEITPQYAMQLAKHQRQERAQQQTQQITQQSQQDRDQYQQQITQMAQTAESYFKTREGEADHTPKMKQMHAYFSDPQKMQEFVSTYEPRQWFAQFKFMYDNMAVQQPPRPTNQPQPIRSRPVNAGTPASDPSAPLATRLMSHLDSLGI